MRFKKEDTKMNKEEINKLTAKMESCCGGVCGKQ